MKKPRPACLAAFLVTIAILLVACGDNRLLQSVSVTPASATSQAQFTATGIYNQVPTSVDITATTTWCVGSASGMCVGNIIAGASISAGLAHCQAGFTGTLIVLAGQHGPMGNPDVGSQLNPFGAAQLTCP